ncbi:hypothetical protein BBB56_18390 [Candidatus Pantoea deserta]|uniref:Uncharacterized protein n=1 Tax=Candidatus Pantoea deserta TaxID=1869313 RepID=A0A3N4NTH1_9GAMM|nr:hypothetical protein BBB56_18390 [Pantoea deserta]
MLRFIIIYYPHWSLFGHLPLPSENRYGTLREVWCLPVSARIFPSRSGIFHPENATKLVIWFQKAKMCFWM